MENKVTKLKEVSISGYKSISRDCPLTIELGDISIFLGANGSGKSNIISFFKMLSFMMSGSFQLFVEKAGTSQVFLNYGAKYTDHINGKLIFEGDTHVDQYSFQLSFATPDRLIIASEKVEWGLKGGRFHEVSLVSDFKESALRGDTKNRSVQAIHNTLSNCKVYQFHDSSLESPIRQSSPVDGANYLQSEGNNLASFLHQLKAKYRSNYDRIVSYIHLVMPQFKDFYLEPNERGYVSLKWIDVFPNDYVLLPEQFSDGTIRFIALATLLLQPRQTMPSVVIIDEPELGLHPIAIRQLAEMLKEASKNSQVIVATQSPGLIDEFDAGQITVIEAEDEHGYSTARKLDEEELKAWLDDYSLSELWDKNVLGGRP